jgi:hypothetical protein
MKTISILLLALSLPTVHAATPETYEESCEQIREQIQSHTGAPTNANTILLGKVGANQKCRFTSAEAYRAAWGDKPVPKYELRERRSKDREHDDD